MLHEESAVLGAGLALPLIPSCMTHMSLVLSQGLGCSSPRLLEGPPSVSMKKSLSDATCHDLWCLPLGGQKKPW